MPDFDAVPCWEVPVGHTVASDVGSLSATEDPVFFATHVELPIHQQKGGSGLKESGDVLADFQAELTANPRQNTVVAVTGPSGSGKSHLVRWVQAKLSLGESDILVYVPRHVTTLRATIELVCDQLGGDVAAQVRERLDAAVGSVSEAQLSSQLIDALCQVLEHEPSTAGIKSADMVLPAGEHARRGLPSVMRLEKARDHLLAEHRTVRRLAASILGQNTGGDRERPQFETEDLGFLDMAGMEGALDHHSVTALRLLSRDSVRSDAVELINRSVDAAVQRTLGWRDGPSLRTVFTDVRQRLAGGQLVLLFEDLALVNFVEGAILDEFANHGSDTRAAMRVLFAVTDDRYTALAETIEGRVTSHFTVGALPLGDGDDDALAIRQEFIARHLNLARVGRARVLAADTAGENLPVKCNGCTSRDECFTGFGSVRIDVGTRTEDVGLFPYNHVALRRAFASLDIARRRDNRRVTARSAIDWIVIRGLDVVHDALNAGSMPSAAVASIVDDDSFAQARDDVLAGANGLEEATQDRVYRTRVFWMDEGLETPELAVAFGLPDLDSGGVPPGPVEPPVQPPPAPLTGSPPAFIQEVLRWVNSDNDGELLEAKADEDVRALLERLVGSRVDLRPHLIAPAEAEAKRLLGIAFGRNSFSLGGSGRPQKGRVRFELERVSSTYRLVVGAAWINDNRNWDFGTVESAWSLPKLSEKWSLPVEIESFLSECAASVEGAVVAAITGGPDPATVAHRLRTDAAAAVVDDAPPAWRSVVHEAVAIVDDVGVKSTVLSLAGAVGPSSSRADVAALDVARLDGNLGGGDVSRLGENFPHLLTLIDRFDAKVGSALPELTTQVRDATALLVENVGRADLGELANAVVSAGQAANQAGFFRPGDRFAAFLDACKRLSDAPKPPEGIADRLEKEQLDEGAITDATRLLSVARDVELLVECCATTEPAGRDMLSAAAGGVDPTDLEQGLMNAGEDFIGALRELAEGAHR